MRHHGGAASLAALHRAQMAAARRKMRALAEAIRTEASSVTFTALETTFGEQSEGVLLAIERGLIASLKDADFRFDKHVESKYQTPNVRVTFGKPSGTTTASGFDPRELGFVQAISQEVVDLVGQYVQDFLGVPFTQVKLWVQNTSQLPEMAPEALLTAARQRSNV